MSWNWNDVLTQLCGFLGCIIVGALGIIVIWRMVTGAIDLEFLVSEPDGHASMSRFQLLIFTFVVAISLMKLVEMNHEFPKVGGDILALLGISATTYAVGKSMQKEDEPSVPPKREELEKAKAELAKGPTPPQP